MVVTLQHAMKAQKRKQGYGSISLNQTLDGGEINFTLR
jgi:hypothetical protein